jgi:hypothetical protein
MSIINSKLIIIIIILLPMNNNNNNKTTFNFIQNIFDFFFVVVLSLNMSHF